MELWSVSARLGRSCSRTRAMSSAHGVFTNRYFSSLNRFFLPCHSGWFRCVYWVFEFWNSAVNIFLSSFLKRYAHTNATHQCYVSTKSYDVSCPVCRLRCVVHQHVPICVLHIIQTMVLKVMAFFLYIYIRFCFSPYGVYTTCAIDFSVYYYLIALEATTSHIWFCFVLSCVVCLQQRDFTKSIKKFTGIRIFYTSYIDFFSFAYSTCACTNSVSPKLIDEFVFHFDGNIIYPCRHRHGLSIYWIDIRNNNRY